MPTHEHETDPMILQRRWETDLAKALDDADALSTALSRHDQHSAEATLLRTRLKAVKTELMVLRDLSQQARAPRRPAFPMPERLRLF